MRIIKLLIITLCTLAFSCQRYDDSAVWDELKAHAERIAALEALCAEMNSNITALDEIVAALQENEYVTEITDITENGKVIGYTITFSKRGRVAIYHGKAGVPGAPGAPGQDGEDGTDGKDGHTPTIGVRKDTDGIFYWTLDGEWLTDSEGNKIPTTGIDGADGQPGTPGADGQPGAPGTDGEDGEQGQPGHDGEDGITPLLKIEDEYWYISYDNGKSWQQLYKAVGEDGKDGQNGAPGKDGEDGQSFFQSVDTTNPNYIILTLADGTAIKIPTWKAFEELQTKVNQMNTNLAALQVIIDALQNKDYVTDITTAIENGIEVGYTIYFSKSQPITIYHGKDGEDGTDGENGTPGADGTDGKDGHTPVIGIRKATDEDWALDSGWIGDPATDYYWTIDGEWLLDSNGNKIPATGHNGTTPLLKIEDGIWYISTDGGKTWQAEGPATGSNVESIFTDISYTSEYIYITLATGETISIPCDEGSLLDHLEMEITEVTNWSATFVGSLNVPAEDLAYSQVTLYYSDDETFNIYTAESLTSSVFDYNQSFSILLTGLNPDTEYKYCMYVRVRTIDAYSSINTFTTKESGPENNFDRYDFTRAKFLNSKHINSETGGIGAAAVVNTYIACEDYIPVKENTTYIMTLSGVAMPMRLFAWYDSEKRFLSGRRDKVQELVAPEGAAYLRITLDPNLGWYVIGEQLFDENKHLINPDPATFKLMEYSEMNIIWSKGYYIARGKEGSSGAIDGEIKAIASNWATTDYIDVSKYKTLKYNGYIPVAGANTVHALYGYDKDKKPVTPLLTPTIGYDNYYTDEIIEITNQEIAYVVGCTYTKDCEYSLEFVF